MNSSKNNSIIIPARIRNIIALLLICLIGSGCASSEGPEFLTIKAGSYHYAFDTAVDAAREAGFTSMVKDRRSGIIETDPKTSGSLIDPWQGGISSWDQAVENTISHQRRRARFEFVPVGFKPANHSEGSADEPDLFDSDQMDLDLTRTKGNIELRVWVYIERAHAPGRRRSTWTRSKSTRMKIVPSNENEKPIPSQYWTPVQRDQAFERRLLAEISSQLSAASPQHSAISSQHEVDGDGGG